MKTIRRALGAGAVAVLLAACGGSPTGAAAETSTPSFETGYGMGSGNRGAPADSTGGETNSSADTAERGGFTMGSGG